MSESKGRLPSAVAHGALVIPCSAEDFGDFISQLLGKPQVTVGKIKGPFCLSLEDIENFHHLVDQRVREQNHGKLIQLAVAIRFDDGTSVEVSSLEELRAYSEVRPVIFTGASLVWVYLITFPGRNIPERQQIEVEIQTRGSNKYFDKPFWEVMANPEIFDIPSGIFEFRVNYTSRTWGSDIENLLRDHMQSLVKEDISSFRRLMLKWNAYVQFLLRIVVAAAVSIFLIRLTVRMSKIIAGKFQETVTPAANTNDLVIEKLSSLFAYISDVALSFNMISLIFIVLTATLVSGWVTEKFADRVNFQMPSFILLTRRSEENRRTRMANYEKNWRNLILAFLGAILTGVIANLLSTKLF